jgi:hypothetical protein
MADERNFVGPRRFLEKRVGASAVGTLQIFKDHERDPRALRGPQRRRIRGKGGSGQQAEEANKRDQLGRGKIHAIHLVRVLLI